MAADRPDEIRAGVDLYWIPLGAGDAFFTVRWSGRAYEALVAHREHRARRELFHSALEVRLDGHRHVIEMAPVWRTRGDRGVVATGPVGLRPLGRSALFRYEVRRWRDGVIPDLAAAVDSPRRISDDSTHARRVLDLAPLFPCRTWGRDELGVGDMWNSNSLTSWLLAASGHELAGLGPPGGGRAPGWSAGLVAARQQRERDDPRSRRGALMDFALGRSSV